MDQKTSWVPVTSAPKLRIVVPYRDYRDARVTLKILVLDPELKIGAFQPRVIANRLHLVEGIDQGHTVDVRFDDASTSLVFRVTDVPMTSTTEYTVMSTVFLMVADGLQVASEDVQVSLGNDDGQTPLSDYIQWRTKRYRVPS